MRYLGVDPGGARLGLALGDDITGVVSALDVVPCRSIEAAARTIVDAARSHHADRVVIGLPTSSDGGETPACRRSRAIAEAVTAAGLEVILQPEFLTTDEARRRAREVGLDRRRPVDHLAAQIILEEFLSEHGA